MPAHRFLPCLLLAAWAGAANTQIATPECTDVAAWAAGFDPKATRPVAPAVSLPAALGEARFVELFGKPIAAWSVDDFSAVDQQFKTCQGALFKSDRAGAKQIQAVRRAFRSVTRSVGELTRAGTQAGAAVAAIAELPDDQNLTAVLDAAAAALGGEDVAGRLPGLPPAAGTALQQLVHAQPRLATATAEDLAHQLVERRAELEAALAAQQQAAREAQERARVAAERDREAARAELAAAERQLAALPERADALPELDRLAALPALTLLPSAEAQPFREALAAKRAAVDALVQRERAAQLAQDMAARLEELRDTELDALAKLGPFRGQVQHLGRLAAEPNNADAAAAAGVTREALSALLARFDTAAAALLPRFEERLAAVPETTAGRQQLNGMVERTTGVRDRNPAMRPYYAAAEQRLRAIDAALRHAAEWFPVTPRLEALLLGDEVDELSVRGLRPGAAHADAVARVKREWGFEETPSMDLEKSYGYGRKDLRRMREERRSGGELTLKAMGDDVGQVEFVEHYQGKLELAVVRDWLVQHFGKPDRQQPLEHGIVWTWHDGDRRLQVWVNNQVDVIMYANEFRSKLGIALWNEDYEDYLVEATERCDRIRQLPRSEISMDDSMFFVTAKCPLVAGYRLEPGLRYD